MRFTLSKICKKYNQSSLSITRWPKDGWASPAYLSLLSRFSMKWFEQVFLLLWKLFAISWGHLIWGKERRGSLAGAGDTGIGRRVSKDSRYSLGLILPALETTKLCRIQSSRQRGGLGGGLGPYTQPPAMAQGSHKLFIGSHALVSFHSSWANEGHHFGWRKYGLQVQSFVHENLDFSCISSGSQ